MAGPLSITVDASVKKPSWKSRALGLCASFGLQTGALLALGVAPLVTLDDLPDPQGSESVLTIPVIPIPAPPPAASPTKISSRKKRVQRPRVPSRFVAPTEITDEIPIEDALEDLDEDFPVGVIGGVPYAGVGAPDTSSPPPPVVPGEPAGPVVVGTEITPPRKRVHVSPIYPPIAIQARVQGTVVLEATIDVEGNVVDLKVLKSVPLLDGAALDAVRQWKYQPTYLNGRPVPVVMSVNVDFQLSR